MGTEKNRMQEPQKEASVPATSASGELSKSDDDGKKSSPAAAGILNQNNSNNKDKDAEATRDCGKTSQPHVRRRHNNKMKKKPSPTEQRKAEETRLAVMFGSLLYDFTDSRDSTPKEVAQEIKHVVSQQQQQHEQKEPRQSPLVKGERKESSKQESAFQAIFNAINKEIPHEPEAIQQSRVFVSTKKLIQFQRDQYLVGADYATMAAERRVEQGKQKEELERQAEKVRVYTRREQRDPFSSLQNSSLSSLSSSPHTSSTLISWETLRRLAVGGSSSSLSPPLPSFPPHSLPYDPTALGYQQLAHVVATQLLPLPALKEAALPLVCQIPTWIYEPTEAALVDIILGQEEMLAHILKHQLLSFLDNPSNRLAMKNSTQGFILSSATKGGAVSSRKIAHRRHLDLDKP